MGVGGIWYSTVGSKLELHEDGHALTGSFDSVQQPGQAFDVFGSIYPDATRRDRTLSFSVAWIEDPAQAKYRSVTSYTGQYHYVEGVGEFIDVVFLLANETTPGRSFASVFVGHDWFSRLEPSQERIELDQALRASNTGMK